MPSGLAHRPAGIVCIRPSASPVHHPVNKGGPPGRLMDKKYRAASERGRTSTGLVIVLLILAAVLAFVVYKSMRKTRPEPPPPVGGPPSPFPEMKEKPNPVEITFKGCPPEGD